MHIKLYTCMHIHLPVSMYVNIYAYAFASYVY